MLNYYLMNTMKIEWIKGLIIGGVLCLVISCYPNDRCDFNGTHDFLIPSTLTPALDTFSVGDTIFFSSIFEDRVYDRGLGEHVVLSDFKFNPSTYLIRIDTVDEVFALEDFKLLIDDLYNLKIRNTERGRHISCDYYYDDNSYTLEFSIIPRKEGLYLFNHILLINLTPGQTFDEMCPNLRGWLDSYSDLNDTADNNIEFLKFSPNAYYNDRIFVRPDEWFHSKGGYCFFVKE